VSIEERFNKANVEMQQQIKKEIDNVNKGLSNKSISQLNMILDELKESLNHKGEVLSYPRMIIDSWDFQDKLGLELLDLAELYKRWK